MAGKLMKGALVQFMEAFLVPVPNVIVFQFNPETITHTWAPATGPATEKPKTGCPPPLSDPLAVCGYPTESFGFKLVMNSDEVIAGEDVTAALAKASGVATRLAALEMLQYPVTKSGAGVFKRGVFKTDDFAPTSRLTAGAFGKRAVPSGQLPTVLFVWGPGRIVPVRVSSLTITEKTFDSLLNPTHAEVEIRLAVLTPEELSSTDGPKRRVARAAYAYAHGLRQTLAAANVANATESIIGLLS